MQVEKRLAKLTNILLSISNIYPPLKKEEHELFFCYKRGNLANCPLTSSHYFIKYRLLFYFQQSSYASNYNTCFRRHHFPQ